MQHLGHRVATREHSCDHEDMSKLLVLAIGVLAIGACSGGAKPAPATAHGGEVGSGGPATGSASQSDGQRLFEAKGCNTCHTIDGSPRVGPTLKAVWGTTVKLEGGSEAVVDEAYVRESILQPNAKIVAGFPPIQPSFEGQLSETELAALVAYVKSL